MTTTVLIDGIDVEAERRHIRFQGWGGMFATAGLVGDNDAIPNRAGQRWREKTRDVGIARLQFSIVSRLHEVPAAMAAANREWFDLVKPAAPRRRPVELTRVLQAESDGVLVEHRQTAAAELVDSIEPDWVSHRMQRGTLTFRLLDGCWFDEDSTSWDIPSGRDTLIPARGTTDTSRILITLTGGVGVQTLTNVSAGVSVSIDWAGLQAGAKVTIDVEAFKVLADGAAALTRVSHAGDRKLMIIDPDLGDNRFTLTSGAVKLSYFGAWL